ncbi:hypothetical protein ACFWJT_38140, partial [Streptomyces sp. NPDC127069]
GLRHRVPFSAPRGPRPRPPPPPPPPRGGPPPPHRRLLRLLAGGAGDEVIARELGISRRTFFRRLQILMARLGAENRFQMALQAQRNGWL